MKWIKTFAGGGILHLIWQISDAALEAMMFYRNTTANATGSFGRRTLP
ncbi:MAG: hypothetical protein A07HR60_01669 [uncultured archaeon A07HR60]|nr:MAG: hypothetical protein A07HR60_01669 [uncultured archaeon A07HR60]